MSSHPLSSTLMMPSEAGKAASAHGLSFIPFSGQGPLLSPRVSEEVGALDLNAKSPEDICRKYLEVKKNNLELEEQVALLKRKLSASKGNRQDSTRGDENALSDRDIEGGMLGSLALDRGSKSPAKKYADIQEDPPLRGRSSSVDYAPSARALRAEINLLKLQLLDVQAKHAKEIEALRQENERLRGEHFILRQSLANHKERVLALSTEKEELTQEAEANSESFFNRIASKGAISLPSRGCDKNRPSTSLLRRRTLDERRSRTTSLMSFRPSHL